MKIELLNFFGDDLMVVNAARVSYGKQKLTFEDNDAKLINYLVKHQHTSPFRHPQIQYRITCPIYIERQLFKHQVGLSANSISGRYVDFSDSYTQIDVWRKQSESSKQGSGEALNPDLQHSCYSVSQYAIDVAKDCYDHLISMGVSKEQARTILPLNLNTTFIWTGSLMAYIHLFKLRLKPDAQQETRIVVQRMFSLLKQTDKFNITLQAFNL
jgi:thymidylate synthase (FAD)